MAYTNIKALAAKTPTEYFIAYVHDAEINDNYLIESGLFTETI